METPHANSLEKDATFCNPIADNMTLQMVKTSILSNTAFSAPSAVINVVRLVNVVVDDPVMTMPIPFTIMPKAVRINKYTFIENSWRNDTFERANLAINK